MSLKNCNRALASAVGWLRASKNNEATEIADKISEDPSPELVLAGLNVAARLEGDAGAGATHFLFLAGATVSRCPGEPPDPL